MNIRDFDLNTADRRNGPVYFNSPIPRRYFGATATGGTDQDEWKRLMREWYGLVPCRGYAWHDWAMCPHRVGNGRCPENCAEWRSKHMSGCRAVWDHERAWRDVNGLVVITLEPYGDPFMKEEAETVERLRALVDPMGIEVNFEGRSPYGASYMLALMAKGTGR